MSDSFIVGTEPEKPLTPAQVERLVFLMEECSEVIKAAAKVLRHGYMSYDPKDKFQVTNLAQLEVELGDVAYAQQLLSAEGDVSHYRVKVATDYRASVPPKWFHHQGKKG